MRRPHRLLCAALALAVLVGGWTPWATSASASPTPPPAACGEAPRTLAAVQALPPAATAAVAAAPTAMPKGAKPDAATAAAIAAAMADYSACVAAGNVWGQLGFFSDGFIRRAAAVAGLPPSQLTDSIVATLMQQYAADIVAVRHLRLIAKDRAALVIVTKTYVLAYLELTLVGKRWLIDLVALAPTDPPTLGRAYTDPFVKFGVEWDAAWKTVAADKAPMISDFTLDNGVSVLMFRWTLLGVENLQATTALAQCVAPPSELSFTVGTVDPASIHVARDKRKRPQRGAGAASAFGVYDLRYYPRGDFTVGAGKTGPPSVAYRRYVECRTLPGQTTLLQITQLAPAGAYDAQVPARQAVLKTVETAVVGS